MTTTWPADLAEWVSRLSDDEADLVARCLDLLLLARRPPDPDSPGGLRFDLPPLDASGPEGASDP